jgi:hypothetical protein
MTQDSQTTRVPIHGYDIRHYFERPDGLDTEMHCYRNLDEGGSVKHEIVLHLLFYVGTPPPNAPVYENLPITFNYPIDRLLPLLATFQSGAPVELFLEIHLGKMCHRLHSNTIGWLRDGRVASVETDAR